MEEELLELSGVFYNQVPAIVAKETNLFQIHVNYVNRENLQTCCIT